MQANNTAPATTRPAGKPAYRHSILGTAALGALISSCGATLVFAAVSAPELGFSPGLAFLWLINWGVTFLLALPAAGIVTVVCRWMHVHPRVEFLLALLAGLLVDGAVVAFLLTPPPIVY